MVAGIARLAAVFVAAWLLPLSATAEIGLSGKRPDFFVRVRAALTLLRDKAPADLKVIEKFVGRIREVDAWHLSGMNPLSDPPTFSLSITTARISVTWAAGAIAHDACHSKQWHDYSFKHETKWVPDSVWTGRVAELRCIAYQIEIMEKIGAPPAEIEILRRQDGLHYIKANRMREAQPK
jgi:hypothetical protein